ncbi:MAG TPA: TadE/TadG family type IV pilus assembly protein [Pirellulaceae bacterium]|nr:TadE/TadG family type IV pilus assembly protein [Pirellulaceae bacterium]
MATASIRRTRRGERRRGALTVEFALTAPLAFFLFFSALEFGRVNMVRHSMENAAYEAVRRGLVPNTSKAEVRAAAQSVLDVVAVRKAKIQVKDGPEEITVTIRANFNDQGWFAPLIFRNKTLSSTLTMSKDK